MSWFNSVGNWFRGAFGDDDDDEKKVTQQNKATKVNWKPDTSRGAPKTLNLDSSTNINQQNEPRKVKSYWETDSYKDVQKLYQQNLPKALEQEESQLSWWDKNVSDRDWKTRASNTARLKAINQQLEKNDYKPTVGTTANLYDTQQAVKAQQAKDREAREKLENAADIIRMIPGAGAGEAMAIGARRGVASIKDLFSGQIATGENQKRLEDAIRQEQLGITPSQWEALSDEDKTKFLALMEGSVALGALDFAPAASGAKTTARAGAKEIAKQLAKTGTINAGVGGSAGAGVGYGSSKWLGAEDDAAQTNAARGFRTGVVAGLLGTPLDAAIDSVPRTIRNTVKHSPIAKDIYADPGIQIDIEVQSKVLDAGINELRLDPNNPYQASYRDGVATFRDQAAVDDHIYHEAGHALWEKQLTPEEKSLFKGDGEASKEAVGRPGYNDEMVRSEDFSDYLNKALTGRFDEVPDQFKALIAKYAGITVKSPEAAKAAARALTNQQQARINNLVAQNPNMTSQQIAEATQKIKEEMLELAEQAKQSRLATLEAVNQNQARNVETTDALAEQAQQAEEARIAAATPVEGDRLQTPLGNEEVAANDVYQTRKVSELTSYEGAPDRARVEEYKQRIQNGERLEPVIVMRDSTGNLGIEDGKHRYQAYLEMGIDDIPVIDRTSQPRKIPIRAVPSDAEITARYNDALKRLQQGYEIEMNNAMAKPEVTRNALVQQIESKYEAKFNEITRLAEEGSIGKRIEVTELASSPSKGSTPPPPVDAAQLQAARRYGIDDAYAGIDANSARVGDATQETTNPILRFFNAIRRNTSDKYREGIDELRGYANDGLQNMASSDNALTAAPVQGIRQLFDRFGIKDADRMTMNSYNAMRNANSNRVLAQAKEIGDMIADAGDPEIVSQRLYQVFEEPDMLARMYGEGTPKLGLDDLTPDERVIADRLIELNKIRNDVWYAILRERHAAGMIDDAKLAKAFESYKAQADGMHSPRIYDFDEINDMGFAVKGYNTNKGAYMKRKDVEELSQEVIDSINANPANSMLFRLQSGLDELGRIDAVKGLNEAGFISDTPLNKNWVKLEGQQYGALNGKYADSRIVSELENRHIFTSNFGQKASDLLDVYRGSIFGKADRAVKRAKTSYAPGTFLGNLVSNPTFFNRGSGVNMVSQVYNMAKNTPTLVRHTTGELLDPDILEMQRYGVKIGNTADELVGGKQNFQVLDNDGVLKSVKDIALAPNRIYAGADDLAKVSIFKVLKSRGMDSQTSALRAAQFTQDYGNVGRTVQFLADSPILGSPFARFVPELLRLTKNNAIYNPLGTFAGLYALAAIQQKLSADSGESEEEREARENAPGKVKIPFSAPINQLVGGKGDISLDFPVNGSAVNAARALGFNFPLEPGSDPTESLIRNLAPFTIPFREGVNGEKDLEWQMIVSSMFLRPLAEQIANEDFMGRYVDDPTNKLRWEKSGGDETKYTSNLDPETERNNRLYHLFMNWFPLAGETDALLSETGVRDAITQPGLNEEKKDYYGKDRTPLQAVLRSLGIKVENNDQESRDRRLEMNEYFDEEKPITDAFLNDNPDLADAYWDIRSTTRDRYTDVSANDIISPEKYRIISSDTSGRLFNFFKEQAVRESEKTGNPLDPIYTLPPDQANQVIKLKGMYTGDDTKFQQLLYEEPWFESYKAADRKYQEARPEYKPYDGQAKPNPRPKEWYELSEDLYSPEKGVITRYPLVKQYQDELKKFENYDSDERKEFTKAWYDTYGDTYKAEKEKYEAERLAIVNKMRAIEGAPPMSPEVWSGQFKTDDSFGSSWGSRGSSNDDVNNLTELTRFSNDLPRLSREGAQRMPTTQQAIFQSLLAGGGGGRRKPTLGAGSRGQG